MTAQQVTTFTLFPLLPTEVRNKIWSFTLLPPVSTRPPAPRLIHVSAPTPRNRMYQEGWAHLARGREASAEEDTKFIANPASYGGDAHARSQHPVALAVCRESRAEALRYVTLRFGGCYFDLKRDYLFLRERRGFVVPSLENWVPAMAAEGLLDGVENLAVEWKAHYDGHWISILRSIPSIRRCVFIFDPWMHHKELVDPGVPWQFGPIGNQIPLPEEDRQKMDAILSVDKQVHEGEWALRGADLEFEWVEMLHRKSEEMVGRPVWSTRYYEPPGVDFFG